MQVLYFLNSTVPCGPVIAQEKLSELLCFVQLCFCSRVRHLAIVGLVFKIIGGKLQRHTSVREKEEKPTSLHDTISYWGLFAMRIMGYAQLYSVKLLMRFQLQDSKFSLWGFKRLFSVIPLLTLLCTCVETTQGG